MKTTGPGQIRDFTLILLTFRKLVQATNREERGKRLYDLLFVTRTAYDKHKDTLL